MPTYPQYVSHPSVSPTYIETAGITTSGVPYMTQLTGGTVNNFGSWVQLIASTTKRTVAVLMAFCRDSAFTGYHYRVQIGTGNAGNEVGVADAMYVIGDAVVAYECMQYTFIPIMIQSGTRISARMVADYSSNQTVDVALWLMEID